MKTKSILSPFWGMMVASGLFVGVSVAEPGQVADKGETMTKALCMACHGDTQAGGKRMAPPMMMVKSHYGSLKKDEMVKAIVKWVKKPNAKHSKMPGAIRRFGLMPPLDLPDADLKAIAEYVAKTEFAMPSGCGPGARAGQGNGQGKGKAGQKGCDPSQCDPTKCDPSNCSPGQCGQRGKKAGKKTGKEAEKGNGRGRGGCGGNG